MQRTIVGMTAALTLFLALPAGAAEMPRNDAAIRAVEQRQQDAWNNHDAHLYASLFAEDADTVNVLGWWWKGRAELEKKLTGAFASVFSTSVLTVTNVDTRYLAPDIAVVHVRWTMTGAKTPDGNPSHIPQQGIQTQILQNHAGTWQIAAFQNTIGVPEKPFPPAGSPPPVR